MGGLDREITPPCGVLSRIVMSRLDRVFTPPCGVLSRIVMSRLHRVFTPQGGRESGTFNRLNNVMVKMGYLDRRLYSTGLSPRLPRSVTFNAAHCFHLIFSGWSKRLAFGAVSGVFFSDRGLHMRRSVIRPRGSPRPELGQGLDRWFGVNTTR